MSFSSQTIESGNIFTVGTNSDSGILGIPNKEDIHEPIPISDLEYETIIDMASSQLHALVINKHGKLWSWGCELYGALGRTSIGSCPLPINHPSIKHIRFKKVACGNSISLALSTKNQLYAWGTFNSTKGIYGFLPHVEIQRYPRIINQVAKVNFIDISAGTSHCLALDQEGHVYAWGCAEHQQIGRTLDKEDWENDKQCLVPTRLPLQDIIAVQCGAFHSIALNAFGQVYAWGLNHFHQCGLVDMDNEMTIPPNIIPITTALPYFEKNFSFKLTKRHVQLKPIYTTVNPKKRHIEEDELYQEDSDMEQSNSSDHMEVDNSAVVLHIEKSDKARAIAIAAGDYHSIALMSDNTLICWGRCDYGQLGFEVKEPRLDAFKLEQENDTIYAIGYPTKNNWQCNEHIKKVKCGSNHTFVISESGKVWGFGRSTKHQLTFEEDIFTPTLIESIVKKGKVIDVVGGGQNSFFLVDDDVI